MIPEISFFMLDKIVKAKHVYKCIWYRINVSKMMCVFISNYIIYKPFANITIEFKHFKYFNIILILFDVFWYGL